MNKYMNNVKSMLKLNRIYEIINNKLINTNNIM